MSQPPVVIVGAGLAGLSCAQGLTSAGLDVVVLESAAHVGGRVSSDLVDGFVIDRGFQVLNTAYPALGRAVDLKALDLRRLPRGIRVRRGGRLYDVPHPLASPTAPFRAATSGVVGLRDKLALARYAGGLIASSPAAVKRRPDVDARAAWSHAMPEPLVSSVLVPFMAGVVLEPDASVSRVFADLMMRTFARGVSAVPAAGMQALPEAMANRLPPSAVRLGVEVAETHSDGVVLADGTVVDAAAVVVATDPWAAHRLVPELGPAPAPRGVTTYYFAAPAGRYDPALAVDADGSGVVSSVVLTASAPEYSSDGRALIATSVLHVGGRAVLEADDAREAAAQLHEVSRQGWETVAVRDVPEALPAMTAPHQLRKPVHQSRSGTWVAGDHRDTSSIQGALVSGRRAAASLLREVGEAGVGDPSVRTVPRHRAS
ncbi:FAD-dependent oxidoreductase [Nocardioides stalactiti]|uniref:FAD-dependent oxidoreductase n=1 Tax=Nocardioides stalactiti TaxID=2755356 RepID=UPI0015FF215C|nr:FAD-dependent oxidoreductase [Nocardioides stalactiti]